MYTFEATILYDYYQGSTDMFTDRPLFSALFSFDDHLELNFKVLREEAYCHTVWWTSTNGRKCSLLAATSLVLWVIAERFLTIFRKTRWWESRVGPDKWVLNLKGSKMKLCQVHSGLEHQKFITVYQTHLVTVLREPETKITLFQPFTT